MPVFSDLGSTIQCVNPDLSKISSRKMNIGWRNQEVQEIESKTVLFSEDLRNQDSTVNTKEVNSEIN